MYVTPNDLAPFADIDALKAEAMIADAEALAFRVAPCLNDPSVTLDATQHAYVLSILRRAILRWEASGNSGSTVTLSESAGPLSQSQTVQTKASRLLWPSEIADLQEFCAEITGKQKSANQVHTVETGGWRSSPHSEICALRFGALYCSCGADLTNYRYPLWEGGALS